MKLKLQYDSISLLSPCALGSPCLWTEDYRTRQVRESFQVSMHDNLLLLSSLAHEAKKTFQALQGARERDIPALICVPSCNYYTKTVIF